MTSLFRSRTIGATAMGVLVACMLVVAGSGTPAASASVSAQKLRIALDYTPNVDYLGIYVAVAKGYFQAEHIDPQILPYAGPPAETLLKAGKADLGLTYPPNIPAYRASGFDYEAVAGLSQRNTINIAVLASSKYTNVAQLSGTLYGGFGVSSDRPIVDAVFKAAGIKKPVYKEVNLGVDAYKALAAHRVAYSITFGGIDDVTAELSGVKLRQWPIKQFLASTFSFPDDAWVATGQEVRDDPGLLRRGLAALAKGYEYAAHHPAAAEAILVQANKTALAKDSNIVTATGNATAKTFLTPTGTWGPMRASQFTGITKLLVRGGLIPASKAPAPSSDFTNSLLP